MNSASEVFLLLLIILVQEGRMFAVCLCVFLYKSVFIVFSSENIVMCTRSHELITCLTYVYSMDEI